MKIYLVGGAVRDRLLGRPSSDRDHVVVGATPQQLLDLGYKQVGADFPVFLHPRTHEEYALARTERKRGHGYHGFEIDAAPTVTLEQDLERRDLRINAIAEDADGRLIDPFGGAADIHDRWLRHVSPAFAEDPLRVLRVARFAARLAGDGFRVHPDTLQLMREIAASGELAHLVAERVWQETVRALGEPTPQAYFHVLRECGALAVVFPELDRLFGVPQPPQHHPEIDTGVHTLMVLEQAALLSPEAVVRFAALVHDLGKGETPAEHWPRHRGHEQRSVRLVHALCDRLRAPREFRDLAVRVADDHGRCHRALELRPETMLKLLERLDVWRRPERLERFLLACEADYRGRTGLEGRPYPQAERIRRAWETACTVGAGPLAAQGLQGAELGAALRRARVEAIARTS